MTVEPLDIQAPGVAEAVADLQQRAYAVERALLGVEDLPPMREGPDDLRACGETFLAVRDDAGGVAGVVGYTLRDGELEISRLMVDPPHFRRGIGKALLGALAALPAWRLMRVSTGAGNAPAVALYRGMGFMPATSRQIRPGLRVVSFERRAL